jgi:putative intracellular protease/amidase
MTHGREQLSIGVLLFDGAEELDWAGPWEVLSYWSKRCPEDKVDVFTVARDNSRPIQCNKGLKVLADYSWDTAPEIDVLVIPGGTARVSWSATRRSAPGFAWSTNGPT